MALLGVRIDIWLHRYRVSLSISTAGSNVVISTSWYLCLHIVPCFLWAHLSPGVSCVVKCAVCFQHSSLLVSFVILFVVCCLMIWMSIKQHDLPIHLCLHALSCEWAARYVVVLERTHTHARTHTRYMIAIEASCTWHGFNVAKTSKDYNNASISRVCVYVLLIFEYKCNTSHKHACLYHMVRVPHCS